MSGKSLLYTAVLASVCLPSTILVVSAPALALTVQAESQRAVHDASDEQLASFLWSASVTQRAAAAIEVGRRHLRSAAPGLGQLLRDDNEAVRYAAAAALLDMGDTTGVAVVRARLASSGATGVERSLAARKLAEHGDLSGIELARTNLCHKLSGFRLDAVEVLSHSPNPQEAMAALEGGSRDPVALVRIATARCLGRRGDDASIALLSIMLKDEDANVRASAALHLAETGRYDTIPALVGALADSSTAVVGRVSSMLQKLTGYTPRCRTGDEASNRKLEAEWLQWWEGNKGNYPATGRVPVGLSKSSSGVQ